MKPVDKLVRVNYEKEIESLKLFFKFGKKIKKLFDEKNSQFKLVMSEKLKGMRKVLRRLEYVDRNEVVTSKGRVAAVLFGADELLISEMLFSGLFSK